MKHRLFAAAIAAGLATLPAIPVHGQLVAFPGAQGFGADATGGRGGSIYVVTNYNSSGPGSFADAVNTSSGRIVVFSVGGYVDMSAAISAKSNLTILGQTAPGQGIAFMGHEISFNDSSNDIVQYIRAREGSTDTSAKASINLGGTSNMILDHVDAEFSQYDNIDAVGSPTTTNNITLQNSLIADGIKAQQFNMHTEGSNTTYLNNVFANSEGRSVLSKANAQFVDNVVYDYGYAFTTGNSGGVFTYDILNNNLIAGPSTNQAADAFYQLDTNQSAYSSGNIVDGNKNGVLDGTVTAATSGSSDTMNTLTSEWSPATKYLPTLSSSASYGFDVAHAGALYPNGDGTFGRDQVDSLIMSQVQSLGTTGSVMNEQDDDGLSNNGFGTVNTSSGSANSLDTVPFTWLMAHGMSTTNAAALTLPNALGYDMIEEYAQQVGDQYASQTATTGDWATTIWSATKPGIYDHALIRGTGAVNGTVSIGSSDTDTAFTVSIGGNGPAAGESLNVSGGSLTVQDTIYVGDQNNGTLIMTGGTIRANNVQLGNTVWNANGSSSTTYTGTLILNGGILTTGQVVLGGGVPGSWTTGGSISWNGGTLQSIGELNVNAPATLGVNGGILDTNNGTATLSGVISGSGPFKVIGGGTLTLTGTNTYTGVTTISHAEVYANPFSNGGVPGTLGASSNAAANLIIDGGTLMGAGGTDRLFTLTANGGTLDNSQGAYFSNSGAIALPAANVTLTLTGSNTGHQTFSPTLSDPGNGFITSVTKTGAGKWTFNVTGNKIYSGDTTVLAGTLETLANNGLSPNSNLNISSSATFEMHGYSNAVNALEGAGIVQDNFGQSTDALTIGTNNGSGTFSGNLGNGSLPNAIKVGSGTQVLTGTDTYTGTTTISGGLLQFNLPASIGGTGASVTVAAPAAAAAGYAINQAFLARITNTSTGSAALAIASANNLDFSSATGANLPNVSLGAVGSESYTGTITPYSTTYYLGGGGGSLILPNVQLTGSDAVTVTGPGTVTATGTNTYTGVTTILTGGTFAPNVTVGGNAGGMGMSSNAAANLILNGGTFQGIGSTDRSFTLTTLGGSIDNSNGLSLTGPGLVVLPANTNITLTLTGSSTAHNLFNLSLADPGAGCQTSVTKTGTGKWTFSADGTKTYSGPTTIVSGQLEALSGDAFSHYSDLVIDSGASLEMHDNNVTINGLVGTGAIYDSFINGTRTLTLGAQNDGGTWAGDINSAATLNVVKEGTGTEIFTAANTYVGATTVTGGALTLASTASLITTAVFVNSGAVFNLDGSVPVTATLSSAGLASIGADIGTGILPITLASVSVSSGGEVSLANPPSHAYRTLLITSTLAFGGSTNAWQGQLDLGGNDLLVHNGSLGVLTNQVAEGFSTANGKSLNGIFSSLAEANTLHLTALGVIQNSIDGTPTGIPLYGSGAVLGLFDGTSPVDTDVLVKYTYYGDTNLDGKVDGSDYSRIDAGYLNDLTGWYDGDFNYDGVVNGSDYTLIDNTFNQQGSVLTDQIASPTAQIDSPATAVPEPAGSALLIVATCGLLGRRQAGGLARSG